MANIEVGGELGMQLDTLRKFLDEDDGISRQALEKIVRARMPRDEASRIGGVQPAHLSKLIFEGKPKKIRPLIQAVYDRLTSPAPG